jgi:hypothetical protein
MTLITPFLEPDRVELLRRRVTLQRYSRVLWHVLSAVYIRWGYCNMRAGGQRLAISPDQSSVVNVVLNKATFDG